MIQRPARRHGFRQSRADDDPGRTVFDAVAEFMRSHPAMAMEVGRSYLLAVTPEDAPMTLEEFRKDVLRPMEPEDAFDLGLKSAEAFDRRDRLVVGSGSGYGTVSDSEFSRKCAALATDEDFVTAIMCGEVTIPRQMAAVVGQYVDKRELSIARSPSRAVASIGRRLSRLRPRARRRRWRAPGADPGNCPDADLQAAWPSAGRP